MADKQKTIDIIFGGVDNTGSAIGSVGRNLRDLERNIGSVTTPLAGVADSVLKLDAVLAAAAVGLTAYSIKLADDFGTAFAEISTLVGQPASELGDFKNQLQAYAENSTASFEQITNATYNAISAGVDYADSLDVLSQAETLSIAGRADLGVTTKALVSTLNAFGAEMDDAGNFADIFFTTVQKGQTTLPELADNIGQVAPLAAQAGLSFDELGAAIAAITAGAGVSTAEAVTALKGAISNLIKPSKEASDLASQLGIDFSATALKSKGLSGVLEDVALATGGNVEQMAQLFPNVRALTAVLPLTGAAADDFAAAMEAMKNNQGAASTAAKELETDLSKLGQTLKNNVTSAFISFGENFTDETAAIIVSLKDTFNAIGGELKLDDGAFAPLIGQLEGVFQDIERKFEAVAKNIPQALQGLDFTGLLRAFDDLGDELGDSFRAIFGDVDLETVEGLEDALQTVVDAFTALVDVTSGIVSGLEPLFEIIGQSASGFNDLSGETKKALGEVLGFAKSINTILPVVGSLGTGLQSVGNGLIAIAGVKALPILGELGKLSTVAASVGKGGLIGAALFGAGAVGAGIGEGINQLFESLTGDSIGTALYDWINGDEVEAALGQMEYSLDKAGAAAKDFAGGQKEVADSLGDVLEPIAGLDDAYDEQIEALIAANNAAGIYADTVEDSTRVQNDSAGALETVKIKTEAAAEAAKKAAKETKEYQLKLLEIASDERIASIEAKVKLDIAGLEADTKQAVAIIESLGASIQSTGDLLGSLFGNLENATGSKRFDIERQIDIENKLRQQAFDQQKQLTQAQIELLRNKAQQIARGETLIKVNAEGLTPALELIFNEVLEFAQVRANEQGLEFLTGI